MNARMRRKARRARARRWDALGMSGILKVIYADGWTREELLGHPVESYGFPTFGPKPL